MNEKDLSIWSEERLNFFCPSCSFLFEPQKKYDFKKALNR